MNEFNRHQNMIAKVAEALGEELLQRMAFLGGCTTGLFITDEFSREHIRYTNDVDIIVHVLGFHDWAQLQERLRQKGFREQMQEEVICAMFLDDLKVDFMPDNEETLGFCNRWYAAALQNVQYYRLTENLEIPLVQPVYFIATKLEAYLGRGKNDPLGSRDIEDLVNLFDGREELLGEIAKATPELRQYLAEQLDTLLRHPDFEYVVQSTAKNSERENLIFERLEMAIQLGGFSRQRGNAVVSTFSL